MSTLTNNHIGSLRTCWRSLRWQPTTLATTTEKTTLVPEKSRTSHCDIRLATSVTQKLLRTCWKQQKQRPTSKNTKNNWIGGGWSKPLLIFREQQKQRPTTEIYQARLHSDLNFRSNLCLYVGSTTPTTTAKATNNGNETTSWEQQQPTATITNLPRTTTNNYNHQQQPQPHQKPSTPIKNNQQT